jgi:RNA polymerase-binding transcription factor DksA
MQHKSGVARSRMEQRDARGAHVALSQLEREHVALLMALCELEAPTKEAHAVAGGLEVQQALQALLRDDLRLTQHALQLAAHGQYGLCEDCHRPLTRRHLALRPATTRCFACEARVRRAVQA